MDKNETPPPDGATPPLEPTSGATPNTPPGTGETPGTTSQPSIEDAQKENEQLKAALKKANAEAASHRHKANELDKLKAEAEAATLSETEKLQKQLAALQAEKEQATQQAKDVRVSSAIQLQALQQGIDPTLATKLVERADIEYDDAGNPSNVGDLLKALAKQYPTLAGKPGQAPTSGGATNPPRSQSTAPQELSWEVITQLQKDPAEFARQNADGRITKWLYAHPHRYGQR